MTITPSLVATYPIPDRDGARTRLDPTGPVPRLEVRSAESLRIYELAEQAEPAAEFPAPSPNRWLREWTAPDLSFAVFGTATDYVAVARDGATLWKQPYGTWDVGRWGYLDFSTTADQELRIWLRLPSGLPDSTLILTLDAEGTVLARSVLPCGGYERFVSLLWDENDEISGVSVSGGRSAATHYEARWESGAVVLGGQVPQDRGGLRLDERDYLGTDSRNARCMTVDRTGRDVSWHSLPTYRVTASLGLDDFPAPGTGDCSVHNAPYISSSSGFVDDGTAMVTLHNPYDEAAVYMFGRDGWREHSHWLADPATGALHGRVEYPMAEVETVMLIGDGTWITEEWDALHRWRR
ncbi:hypothetical protein BX285_6869 [Streptomyces sp. 1114.5]|uniref:hypothetical protein n=1 Tax=unclassified Streptomyces TaxID=2593676 RepID=UPI000BC64DB5|nr:MULTISPECIES: hypothetical protein [unclassified Streptomyces]RKT09765.1 hypothetical protein BX285_6869 [Streptomyces sp. 1114.5]SOB88885.1 hypothetical protein SAMN06272789_7207 [Streptomyces sp. 1331.2]